VQKLLDYIRTKKDASQGYVLRYGFVERALEKTEEELMQSDNVIGEKALKKA
jgi:hypothetical protein